MALMIHQLARQKLEALEHSVGQDATALRRGIELLLVTYPDFSTALQRLAALQVTTDEFILALQNLQRAVALDPYDVNAWVGLARLHFEKFNEPDHAIKALKRALEIEANHNEALTLRLQIERTQRSNNIAANDGQPVISAIVSTYKSERFLRGCLEDLERQTIADRLEIIVVDSNSPENERAIVEEFQKRFSNIVYIRTEERETVYGAWNRGVKAARGKYLTNANTDDRHRADALEILVRTLEQNPDVTLAYGDCLITQIENETFESTAATRKYQWMEFDRVALLTRGCFAGPQPVWRREVHDEHGYFDSEFVSAGDYEFWLKICRARKFLHVKETLGLYLESPTSVEHSNGQRAAWEIWEARRRYGAEILPGYLALKAPAFVPGNQTSKSETKNVASAQSKPTTVAVVALIGGLKDAQEFFGQKKFAEAWAATLNAIKTRPFHPEGFLLLAEIALAISDSKTARICAQRARHFAPEWSRPKQFLKKLENAKQSPTDSALASLIAKDAARITQHGLRISVCLIVKNEEKFLARCLASIRNLAHQIIVLDTGSTDRTIEIANENGAEVHSFAWCDDFSAARNAALEHATGDWILMLDADEELPADQHERLLADVKTPGVIAHRLPLVNFGAESDGRSYVPRLFRNAPGVFFYGRVHEQVFPSLVAIGKPWGLSTALGTAQIIHYGYSKEMVKDRNKIERNLTLLRKAIEENPTDANLVMNLGLELVRSGELQSGLARYREAFRIMSAQLADEIVPELREVLLSQFTSHLYKIREHDEVVRVLTSPLARNGGLTATLHFALGLSCFELKNHREAVEQMSQCLSKRNQPALSPINKDIFTAAPQHCVALSLMKLGDDAGAEKAFQAALAETGRTEEVKLDYAKFLAKQNRQVDALHKLHEVVAENSRNIGAWRLGGEIALSQPGFLEFACDWTSEAAQHLADDITIVAQRAEALMLSGDTASARELWERVCSTISTPSPRPSGVRGTEFENNLPPHPNPLLLLGGEGARALAALILCELIESDSTSNPNESQEPATSREFLAWYQKLIAMNAQKLIEEINERIGKLSRALPTAAGILEKALIEAVQGELVSADA
jgi:glycosyltransferase involved in cell wall biosynthesis/Tfp pilus assembly protein PilF